jgi:hypothetical protein
MRCGKRLSNLLRNAALRQDWQVGERKDIEVTLRIFPATFSRSHCPCFALLTPGEVQSCITAKMTVSILSPLAGGDP